MRVREKKYRITEGKMPPHDNDLEQTVLGCMILDSAICPSVVQLISQETFYFEKHRYIFSAIVQLINESRPVDMLSVSAQLKQQGKLQDSGGAYYIATLTGRISTTVNHENYCRLLQEFYIKREQIRIGSELAKMAFDEETDALDNMDWIGSEAVKLSELVVKGKHITNQKLVNDITRKIEIAGTTNGITGLKTGIKEIDELFGGYQNSDLIVKGGRPGMGKTGQALSEAINMALNEKNNVAFFSLEMSAIQLMSRAISVVSGVSLRRIQFGNLHPDEWEKYNEAASELGALDNLRIIDDIFDLNSIRYRAKSLKLKGELDIIYIDYLQLIILLNESKNNNREVTVSTISRSLKLLAKELNVPIILLCQLSRAVETRGGDKKPILSDLRESGAIEQDADIVQFIYRPEYYDITTDQNGDSLHGVAFMLIEKHRNGALKHIPMKFIHECTKFEEYKKQAFHKIVKSEHGDTPF